jgi:ankyrin repeat protein
MHFLTLSLSLSLPPLIFSFHWSLFSDRMHYAAAYNKVDAIETLATLGASVEALDNDSVTPLMMAVQMGQIAAMDALHREGADVHAKDKDGVQPIHFAAAYDQFEALNKLLMYGCDVDSRDDDGWTPLFWAAGNGLTFMVTKLYNLGADIDATGNDEINIASPLKLAQKQGHEDVTRLIKSWHLEEL